MTNSKLSKISSPNTQGSSPKHKRAFTFAISSIPLSIPISTRPWELFLPFIWTIPSLGAPIWLDTRAILPIIVAASTDNTFSWNTIMAFLALL